MTTFHLRDLDLIRSNHLCWPEGHMRRHHLNPAALTVVAQTVVAHLGHDVVASVDVMSGLGIGAVVPIR